MQISAVGQSVSWQQPEQYPCGLPQHEENGAHWLSEEQARPGVEPVRLFVFIFGIKKLFEY